MDVMEGIPIEETIGRRVSNRHNLPFDLPLAISSSSIYIDLTNEVSCDETPNTVQNHVNTIPKQGEETEVRGKTARKRRNAAKRKKTDDEETEERQQSYPQNYTERLNYNSIHAQKCPLLETMTIRCWNGNLRESPCNPQEVDELHNITMIERREKAILVDEIVALKRKVADLEAVIKNKLVSRSTPPEQNAKWEIEVRQKNKLIRMLEAKNCLLASKLLNIYTNLPPKHEIEHFVSWCEATQENDADKKSNEPETKSDADKKSNEPETKSDAGTINK